MIDGLNRYSTMKDSGVSWLGEVPEHWVVLPNRAIFDEIKERNRPDADMLSVTITKGVIRQQALLEYSSKKDSSKLDRSAYKLVRQGDIAYNKMRAWQGAVGVSEYEGIVSPAYVVQRPREGVAPRYLHYLLRTPAFAKEAERWSYGITSDTAYQNAKKNSDKQNARIEHDKALARVMTAVLKDDTELFKQFMDNESFRRWMTDTVFGITYEERRAG